MKTSSRVSGARYYFRHRSCDLEGLLVGEQMLITAGSSSRADARPAASETILSRRRRLVAEGVAGIVGERFVLKQNYIFAGPGRAVDLMNGGHVRDPLKLWRDANGTSLHDHQTSK